MSDRELQLIERCKQEIRYRAHYMHLEYDDEDVEHIVLPDGHIVVALTKVYGFELLDADYERHDPQENVEYVREKVPNMWIEWPKRQAIEEYYRWAHDFRMYVHLPFVRVRFPQLVFIILPDGTIKKSDAPEILAEMYRREQEAKVREWSEEFKDVIQKVRDKVKGE